MMILTHSLLLIAHQKINNLDGDVIVDFVTALKMFTRRIVVQNIVEDVQLGVEMTGLSNLCTRLFTLGYRTYVLGSIHMPNKAWTKKDQEHMKTILKKIDVVLLKRRIMRSLKVL
ncbi:hypothetical protein Tco_0822523, partial [Tanacetum coccineum]